jgi:hypothetical protein
MISDGRTTERIPLGRGIHIRFAKDGRALHGGCNEDEIVPIMEWYRDRSRGEERAQLEQWLEQKAKEVEDDRRGMYARSARAEVDARIEKHVGKYGFPSDLTDKIRRHIYRLNAIPEDEEARH